MTGDLLSGHGCPAVNQSIFHKKMAALVARPFRGAGFRCQRAERPQGSEFGPVVFLDRDRSIAVKRGQGARARLSGSELLAAAR